MMELIGLLAVGTIVVLPISALVVALTGRRRIDALEIRLKAAEEENERLEQLLLVMKRESRSASSAPGAETVPLPLPVPDVFELPLETARPAPPLPFRPISEAPEVSTSVTRTVPLPPRPSVPPRPPEPPAKAKAPFDWESLVGVKLFSWLAGIFLVMGAVTFLGYSIQQGWLGPPIRMAIGLLTGVTLLVACELKAARRYATTANALDGAAIAILFSTFYAAHALWKLLPVTGSFLALALVAALAVALSIRRDSIFIAPIREAVRPVVSQSAPASNP